MFMLATTSLSVVHKENPACAVPPCAPNPPLSWNPRQHRRNITRSRALPSLAERRTISTACRASGDCTWSSEFEAHILKVGQGESQLVIYPSGYTILIDAMEPSWNTCNGARKIAEKVTTILGHKFVDVGTPSHWHVDHLGYAGHGGFWCLIEYDLLRFGKLLDRDGGVWRGDINKDGECDEAEIEWHNAGTIGGTSINWVCYATDPENENIFSIRELAILGSSSQVAPPDRLGKVTIINTDGKGATLKDGRTPVSGDHTNDEVPPSENDYCIGLLIEYGDFKYATAGDLDGEYATSDYGYTYNDVEVVEAKRAGEVDVLHVNHHGSSHSSNEAFIKTLHPTVSLISCGFNNTHGHPAQRVLTRLINTGDVYLTNMCALNRDYGDAIVVDGPIVITTATGELYSVANNQYESKKTFFRRAAMATLNQTTAPT